MLKFRNKFLRKKTLWINANQNFWYLTSLNSAKQKNLITNPF